MKNLRISIVVNMLLTIPCVTFAGTECRTMEYPDHYEAVCIGDEKTVAVNAIVPAQSAVMPEQAVASLSEQTSAPLPEQPAAPVFAQAAPPVSMLKALPVSEKTPSHVPSSLNSATNDASKTDAAKERLAYRPPYRVQRAELKAKKMVRIKTIQEELQNQPESE